LYSAIFRSLINHSYVRTPSRMTSRISGHAAPPAIYAVIFTSAFLTILAVALRLYTRFRIVKKPDWDDLLSALALVFACIFTIFVGFQTYYGLGRRLHTLTMKEQTTSLLCLFVAVLAYQISLGLAKCSIVWNTSKSDPQALILTLADTLFFPPRQVAQCLRVFGTTQKFKFTCWVLVAFIIICTAYTCLITVFLCKPTSFFWQIDNPAGTCLPRIPLWFLNSALGITTDLAVAVLPIPVIKTLRLPRRQKNMLIIIFLLGGAVCIVSVVRFYSLYAVASSDDYTYDDAQTAVYSSIEVCFSIIFGCVPSYNAFVAKYFPEFYYGYAGAREDGGMPELNEVSNGTVTSSEAADGARNDSAKVLLPGMKVREVVA
ncbi:Satratoxin biosynthesis SC1 cluster protein 4, partial [Pseudocercospora fuligena]